MHTPKEENKSPGIGITGSCPGFWEPNPGPSWKKQKCSSSLLTPVLFVGWLVCLDDDDDVDNVQSRRGFVLQL